MEAQMENVKFKIEVPTVIKIWAGRYDRKNDCTPVEIKATGLHIIFDLPGDHKSGFAQKRIAEAVRRLDKKGLLPLANTRLWPVIQQLP
ncbi:hypothetical protein B6D52_01065 [Candidatus Parcubacteria bacterium 4484_255]|nr:MAG: hypothetical protein B6D52_01065 [Candidatus Parcubacteria bacterium 4484_255]